MKYKLVVDSCCDFPEDFKMAENIEKVPLTLHVGNDDIVDDDTFDQQEFLKKISESEEGAKSSCPSPARYMEAYEGDYDCVFVVTLSANLSGSWNSAEVGKQMYFDEHPEDKKQIYVFDSCSASTGEARIAAEIINEAQKEGATFESVVENVLAYKKNMKTYFVIETLEPLRKNGRLTGIQAVIASVLNIKPIMAGDEEGKIIKLEQSRGMEKALSRLCRVVAESISNPEDKVLSITHCNNRQRAMRVKEEIEKLVKFKNITVADAKGVSTLYACDGGIIISG